jgi:ABC-type transporter Mla subunit MlaD
MRALVSSVIAAVAAVVLIIVIAGGGEDGHELHVTVDDAASTVVGQRIRAGGVKVGEITSIEPIQGGRKVKLGLRLDDAAWPLPTGSKMQLRWGGTANYDDRYIALTLGPRSAPPVADGAAFPSADFTTPVELDTFLATFTPKVRTDLRGAIDDAGATLKQARPGLTRALAKTPQALDEASHVMVDLTADQRALDTLLRQADSVVNAVQTADPGLKTLLTGAAQTFDAVAARQGQLKQTLQAAPGTFAHARTTLASADTTLNAAAKLTQRLNPGVTELRRIASPLNHVLGTVVKVGPDARDTLATARKAVPDLNPLLTKVTAQLPQLGDIGKQATEQLTCLRPYSPEIASFFSNWGDFLSDTDGRDKFIRANVIVPLPSSFNALPYNSGTAKTLFPGTEFGFPRPPGGVAGQPWYQPDCGVTPDQVNPFLDSEARK